MKIHEHVRPMMFRITNVFANLFMLLFISCPIHAVDSAVPQTIAPFSRNVEPVADSYLASDLRHWDRKECELLDDIYLRAVCLRKQRYRPHMNIFVTTNKVFSIKNGSVDVGKCSGLVDDYSKLYCLYTTAAYYAKSEPAKAHQLCQQLQEDRLLGECKFYMAVSMAMSLERDTAKGLQLLMDFCGAVRNSNWRSECYFLLADELAFLDSAGIYLRAISKACDNSNKAQDFGCFSHVVMFLPPEERNRFCDLSAPEDVPGCYWGIGVSFLTDSNDVRAAIKRCGLVEEQSLQSFCLGGVSYYTGVDFAHIEDKTTADLLIQRCMTLPLAAQHRTQCVRGLGVRWGFKKGTAGGGEDCLNVDKAYQRECFQGLSRGLLYKGTGFEGLLDECSAFPRGYRDVCFTHAANVMGLFDLAKGSGICDKFPYRFRRRCFER